MCLALIKMSGSRLGNISESMSLVRHGVFWTNLRSSVLLVYSRQAKVFIKAGDK
jgi:hypothetical protein